MVLEPVAESEAVVACRIDIHGALVASQAHSLVVLQSVGHERHQTVVTGRDDQCRRRDVALHGIHRREVSDECRILLSLLAEEVDARPLVADALIHRNDGIEQYREVGPYVEGRVGADD